MLANLVDASAKARLFGEINALMVAEGFAPGARCWRRRSDETITALFIENYLGSYLFYLSIGVYLPRLEERATRKPSLKRMHAQTRLNSLTPVTISTPQIALVPDGSVDTVRVVDEVLPSIRRVGLGVLGELSSIEGTRRVLGWYGEMRWTIGPRIRESLFGNPAAAVRGELPIQDWEIAGSVYPFQTAKAPPT